MGSVEQGAAEYSVLTKCAELLQSAALHQKSISCLLPDDANDLAKKITFTGSEKPSIPVNWRFAESIGVLKALEGIQMNAFLRAKYHVEPQDIIVNVDHAQLFIISCLLTRIEIPGKKDVETKGFSTPSVFSSCDIFRNSTTPYRTAAGNLYRTKDGRYFHLHSDLNPDVVQNGLGLPHDVDGDLEEVYKVYENKTEQYTSVELDILSNDKLRRSGTVAWSVEEYRNSAHGRAEAETGLWEIQEHPNPIQKPCWWPETEQTSVARPLAGLKVLDFSRIIAAPTATRGLAEYGASVMRVTAKHLPDMGFLHPDMGWGKWNCSLDLRNPEDVEKAKQLMADADVVVYGYRPVVLEKYGLGAADAIKLCSSRERGVIVLQLNCYGWKGPWSHRSGWQQISDACCGISLEYGRAMHGRDEPVTPMFPNSDHSGGLAGHLGVLSALMKRAEKGGSYTVTCSLNGYSQWLANSIGTYPKQVWEEVWERHDRPKFRHYHPMQYIFPRAVHLMRKNAPQIMDSRYFELRNAGVMGCMIHCVKPVLQFPQGKVKLGFQVSTRTNGIDASKWPHDLLVDKVE